MDEALAAAAEAAEAAEAATARAKAAERDAALKAQFLSKRSSRSR